MQTFLPYPDFLESARVLDRQRLGKQRVEAYQILKALTEPEYGWKNHPAVKMWKGHEGALAIYGLAICNEWHNIRGYKDTMADRFRFYLFAASRQEIEMPDWFGNPIFHKSHQSNLLRKNEEHYRKFFKNTPSDLPYIWPV